MWKLVIPLALVASAATAQTVDPDVLLVPVDSKAATLDQFKAVQGQLAQSPDLVIDKPDSIAGFSARAAVTEDPVKFRSIISPTAVAALPLSRRRINDVSADVTALLKTETGTKRTYLSTLRESFKNTATPYVDLTTLNLATPAAGVIAGQGANGQFDSDKDFAAALLRARASGFGVRASEIKLLVNAVKPAGTTLNAFDVQYNATLQKLSDTLHAPSADNQAAFKADAALTRDKFIEIWPSIRDKPKERGEAVRRFAGLMEQSSLKAVYALSSNYDPPTYSSIYDQSIRTVALFERDEQFCSGYLISEEWVMTAGHCLKRGDVQGMKASIALPANGPTSAATFQVSVDDKWPGTGTGLLDTDPIDFVFLHLAGSPQFDAAWPTLKAQAPLCLQKDPPDYEKPVIVIGYQPQTPIKVYDNAYVWFPFRVLPQRYLEVSAMTGAKLERLAEAWFSDPAEQENFFKENMDDFDKSYAANGNYREYRAERAGLAKRPYFGMDTDTFHGDSGAPVFDRDKVCVVGVFSGGALENAQIDEGTWKEHEFAIPLSEIVKYVRALDIAANGATDSQKASRQALLALLPN